MAPLVSHMMMSFTPDSINSSQIDYPAAPPPLMMVFKSAGVFFINLTAFNIPATVTMAVPC